MRTPLVRLEAPDSPAEIWLKLENLQPIGSFKLRGAYNKMAQLPAPVLKRGVIAASAGNHAQGVALAAQKLACRATIVMPVTTPQIKIAAVKARGAQVMRVPVYRWALPEDVEPLKKAVTFVCRGEVDVAIFTTSVQVVHLWQIVGEMGLEAEVAGTPAHHDCVDRSHDLRGAETPRPGGGS